MAVAAKICGITTVDALEACHAGGAAYAGLVFFEKSPRHINLADAAGLAARPRAKLRIAALLVNASDDFAAAMMQAVKPDVVQFHGQETAAQLVAFRQKYGCEVWRAISVSTAHDVAQAAHFVGAADKILFDAKPNGTLPGGTGLRFDWRLLGGASPPLPWLLAGGLTADVLADAVTITGARAVDVSSGVESAPGVKDVDKIRAFLQAAQQL